MGIHHNLIVEMIKDLLLQEPSMQLKTNIGGRGNEIAPCIFTTFSCCCLQI